MAKVVNLRRARKDRARAEKRRSGDENAARHGATKPEERLRDKEAEQAERRLDGHKLEDGE